VALTLTILAWTGAILGLVLLALVLALLFVPWHVHAAGWVHNWSASGRLEGRWGWGLLSITASPEEGLWVHLLGLRLKKLELAAGRKKKRQKEKKKRGVRFSIPRLRTLLYTIRRLLGTIRFSGWIAGSFGFDDPGDTGIAAEILRQLARAVPGLEIAASPNYMDSVLDLQGEIRVRLWPVHTALIFLLLMLRRDQRKALLFA